MRKANTLLRLVGLFALLMSLLPATFARACVMPCCQPVVAKTVVRKESSCCNKHAFHSTTRVASCECPITRDPVPTALPLKEVYFLADYDAVLDLPPTIVALAPVDRPIGRIETTQSRPQDRFIGNKRTRAPPFVSNA